MGFPASRLRRLRQHSHLREMVRETELSTRHFVLPYVVTAGQRIKRPIGSLPGHAQWSPDQLVNEVPILRRLGIPAVLLFGIPQRKDARASEASRTNGPVQEAIRRLKDRYPELVVMTDVCLCSYMSHGHCGVLQRNGRQVVIDNDASLELLAHIAVSHAEAGADLVAPSDMMDGRVKAIRHALDERGYERTGILSYAAKYASSFYGPFRDAVDTAPHVGDRQSYQMDIHNVREALREVALDIEEGADIVMVKPAMPYLDVITAIRHQYPLPLAAYQVSGEYGMIKAAAARRWMDESRAMMESLTAIKRAGADVIITYFAQAAARFLQRPRRSRR